MIKFFELAGRLTSGMAFIITAIFTLLTTVTYLAAAEAIAIIAPILAWSLAGLGLAAATVTALAFGIDRCQRIALGLVEFWRDANIARNDTERDYNKLLFEGRLMDAVANQAEYGLIYPVSLSDGKFSSFPKAAAAINQIENSGPLLEAPAQELLPAIRQCENILIIGGKGSGKTTLLQWLESERLESGQTIALDSHAVPGQWAGQYVGNGREYGQIKNAMIALVDKMDGRHKKRTAGQTRFEPINTLIDEFTLLPGYLKQADYDVQEYSFPMLTEGRKVEMNCLWGTHSDRAEPLGMKGMADLKECFDVLVYLKKVKGEYYAICDFGEGKEEAKYILPGPFRQASTSTIVAMDEPVNTIDDYEFMVAEPSGEPDKPSPEEMAIIEAVATVKMDHGKVVWSKVTTLLGWTATGPNNQRIKAVLDKWSIKY